MDAILIYFIKVNIAIATLYLFYRILLHRDTFFREKRIAFIVGLMFALLHPFIDLSSWITSNQPVEFVAQSISTTLPEIVIDGSSKQKSLSAEEMLSIAYGVIVALLLFRILWQTGKVLLIAIRGHKDIIDGLTVIDMPEGTSPFSFFKWVFLNKREFTSRDLEEILHHERIHIKQYHSIDVMFSELFCALFWINPFAWLLKKQLRENLEYLADMNVIHAGFDVTGYQYHLLRLSYQQPINHMANHFNVTQLKNRIIMMNKKKTSLAGLCKYALSLPLFAFLLLSAYAWGAKTNLPTINEMASAAVSSIKDEPVAIDSVSVNTTETNQGKIYETVETMPVFPGGDDALMKCLSMNIRYPVAAQNKSLQGRVVVRFIVSKTGQVTKPDVVKSAGIELDQEALRVISGMPAWTPGKQKGKAVPVYYTLPIVFRLQGANSPAAVSTKPASSKEISVTGYGVQEDKPLTVVDVMPTYPGGINALLAFITSNLHYPKTAMQAGIEGRVIIRFVVSKTGKVEHVEVIKGLEPSCDNEAVRVINLMPNWTPGKQNGKNVAVYYTIPIVYKLKNDAKKDATDALRLNNTDSKNQLIIVDDKPFTGSLSDIKPDDIQAITILKDAAAKAVYGEKGANGVILIKLKHTK